MPKVAFRYTDEHVEFLRAGYMKMGVIKLAAAFNRKFNLDKSSTQIHGLLKARKIKCGRGTGELMKGKSKIVNEVQLQWIKDNCANYSRVELTKKFNDKFNKTLKKNQIVALVKNNKMHSGRTGYYKKGNVPWSAGKKGLGILKANSGSFKKDRVPHNWVPVGSERINTLGYHDKKVAEPNVWVGKHILLWEKHNGPVPINHNIRFIDNDQGNITIENLLLVNKSEHQYLTINNLKEQPNELKPTIILLSRVQAKTSALSSS
jgi:hypothetical protein